jgi:hypothetical protein
MRRALVVALIAFASPGSVFGQAAPYYAVIADPEVKLYAGPSDKLPQTTLLKKGDTLIVYGEENGWLAVQDPPQVIRSISWVRTQQINFNRDKPIPQVVEVGETGATLRAGEMGVAQPSAIQKAKVPPSTILTVIGPGVNFADGTWYPVMPPAEDYRYVPKSAVRFEKPANMAFTVRDTTPMPPAVSPAGGTAPAASIPGAGNPPATTVGRTGPINHPLWIKADAAERDGRLDDAERLYFSLAREMNEPGGDHDIANLCYTRIHALREKKRGAGGSSTSNTRPPSGNSSRPVTDRAPAPAAEPPAGGAHRTGPGKLVRSQIGLDGLQTYRLEDNSGNASLYVVPAPGVALERYVGKRVDVSGVVHTRQGLSKPYIVATAIEVAP